ncbi:hypothetical protein K435DRAFT_965483, partial [Dendrothele bispora CBS 962.96]
ASNGPSSDGCKDIRLHSTFLQRHSFPNRKNVQVFIPRATRRTRTSLDSHKDLRAFTSRLSATNFWRGDAHKCRVARGGLRAVLEFRNDIFSSSAKKTYCIFQVDGSHTCERYCHYYPY